MSIVRRAGTGFAVALSLGVFVLAGALPVAASDSPEGSVNELLDGVASGELSVIDRVVCEEQRQAALRQFDLGTSLGLTSRDDGAVAAIRFRVEDRHVELIEGAEDIALVHMGATLTVALEAGEERALVQAILESDGTQVSDEDLDLMVPLMAGVLREEQELDQEWTLVLANGEWLVCGGLGAEEPGSFNSQPVISFDGLCGLVTIADINAAGPPELQYDSSFGAESYCTYSSSSNDGYSTTIDLGQGDRLDDYRAVYPDGVELTVAQLPAYALDEQLFVVVDDGVLQLDVTLAGEAPGSFDATPYLRQLARLLVPLVADFEVEVELEPSDPDIPDIGDG